MHLQASVTGDGPPLVLLHGLFGRGANLGVVRRLLRGAARVIALDLRGHGGSPHGPITYPAMAGDVAETLEGLDALPCTLVGHSMGGKVAMLLALTRPEAVARLLVADIAPVRYEPHFRGYVAAMQGIGPGLSRAEADAALASTVPAAAVRGFLLQNYQTGPGGGWRIDLAGIATALPDIEGWPDTPGHFAGPALFVAGARSDYVRPEHRDVIRGRFPAARFAVLPTGHWMHAEDPVGFTALVDKLLD